MTTARQLYASPMSSNAVRTLLCIAHLEVPVEVVPVQLGNPADHARIAAINPNAKIPVLVEGDLVLWESNAINLYLCDLTPGQDLVPTEPRARAEVLRWLFWQTAHLAPAAGGLNVENMIKQILGKGAPDPAAVAAHTAEFQRFAKVADDHLKGRTYLANDRLSLADLGVAAIMLHAERAKYPLAPFEHLRGLVARIQAMPAWQKVVR